MEANILILEESEAKAVDYENSDEFLIEGLDSAVARLELFRNIAIKEGLAKLPDNAVSWYCGQWQYSIKNGWKVEVPSGAEDPSLTKEASFWLEFQEANYDVITRAGLVLAAGVYGKDKATCDRCFASACNAIDKVEVNLCEDWQSFVPFELLSETINSEKVVNPESIEGFLSVISLAAQKFSGFFFPKINLVSELKVDGYEDAHTSVDVASEMSKKGKTELSDAMAQVRDSLPQRNPITVRVGPSALPAKEDVAASPERLAEVQEKSDKNSTDDSLAATEMHGVVPTEAQQNQVEAPQPNIAVACATSLCRGFMRIFCCR